ncbi:MAG: Uma2 family endonuclease [Cyanobacteria bacterium J06627_28]
MVRTLTRWRVSDYHQMIVNGLLAERQVELIDGQIVDMAPELPIHRATYRREAKYLEEILGHRAVIFSAAPITLPSDGEPQPDIAVVKAPETQYDERHPGPEDIYWLIEVSNSTLDYDLGKKAAIYAADNIKDYWVIDVAGKQIWIHREPQNGRYGSVTQIKSGTITPVAMPALKVSVDRLFTGKA